MEGKVAWVTIWTEDIQALLTFYRDVLGFRVRGCDENCVAFEGHGIRLDIRSRLAMGAAARNVLRARSPDGRGPALTFSLRTYEELDQVYANIVAGGAMAVLSPTPIEEGQNVAAFADPDGNLHYLLVERPAAAMYDF